MVGTFLVAAELSSRGFVPLTTSRNTKAADIVVFSEVSGKNVNIQVKTNGIKTGDSFWLLGPSDRAKKPDNFFYVLVKLRSKPSHPDFYVLPAKHVQESLSVDKSSTGSVWYTVNRKDALPFKDKWELLEKALLVD